MNHFQGNHEVLFLTLLILAMVALIISFFFISIVRYHKRYVRLQQERIAAEITIQENERRRIATDLHDSLGPLLATVKMNIRMVQMATPTVHESLQNSVTYLDEIIGSLRQISYNLLPNSLENGSLKEAITEFSERVNDQHQLGIELDIVDKPEISKEREVHIFRILQEIIHNTIKHAGAKLVQIIFKREGKDFLVLVREDGSGFDVSKARSGSKGLGLKSLESRSEVLHGSLNIESETGKGTTYILRFPEFISLT